MAASLYQIEQSTDNPAHFKVLKLDEDYELLETYHISVVGESSVLHPKSTMICTCPAGTREKGCRHRKMLLEFHKNKVIGQKWSYNYDKGEWIAPLGSLDIDD